MCSLEFFSPSDQKEGMSESAFEAFQEKMKKAAKEMAASQKKEKKHKKKEEDLYKILLAFIKNSKNNELVVLISKNLEKNIPAGFILEIIRLSNKEIDQILGSLEENQGQISLFSEEKDLNPIMKLEMDLWVKSLLEYAKEMPEKVYKTCLVTDKNLRIILPVLLELMSFTIKKYFELNNLKSEESRIQNFANFILNGVLSKTIPKEIKGDF